MIQLDLSLGYKRITQHMQLTNVINYINRMKEKNHMIISRDHE